MGNNLDDWSYFYMINVNLNVLGIECFWEIDGIKVNFTCVNVYSVIVKSWLLDWWGNCG